MNALLTYRRLTEADVPTFVTMRITQLKEEGAQSDLDLEPALTAYYQKHLADGTFVSWLAVNGEKIVGTSGMSFVESRRTTAIPPEKSDCCPGCTRTPPIADKALPENCWITWWKKPEPMAAEPCGSLRLKWVCCYTPHMDSRKTGGFCSTRCHERNH